MPNFREGQQGAPSYFRFNIAWHTHVSGNPTNLAKFLGGFFAFVDAALAQGKSVLVHCLAGAHRAGTAAVLLLMHKDGLGSEEATKAAQALRPIINPIGQLPLLLRRFEALRAETHRRVWAEAEEARQAQELRQKDGKSRAAAHSQAHQQAHQPAHQQQLAGRQEASLDDCIEALHFIGRKADHLFVFAHEVHEAILVANDELPAGEKARPRTQLEYEGAARAVIDEADEEDYDEEDDDDYDDDFEEFDQDDDYYDDDDDAEEEEEEDEPHTPSQPVAGRVLASSPKQQPPQTTEEWAADSGASAPYEEDLAALRRAVEESRAAVRDVEARLHAAEAQEPARDAAVAASRSPLHLMAASVASAMGVSERAAAQALAASGGSLEDAVDALMKTLPADYE